MSPRRQRIEASTYLAPSLAYYVVADVRGVFARLLRLAVRRESAEWRMRLGVGEGCAVPRETELRAAIRVGSMLLHRRWK